jgi:tripartite-type tricarboxylate transporter receptor subunit TctC
MHFEYVGLVTEVPMTIVARKDLEPTDLKGLIEYAKANKDTVTVANAGIGAASHLCGMMFMSAIETPFVTVPYKGTGPAMTDLLGGQVDIMCDQTTNTTKQIQGGTIKAYAVTSPARLGRAARPSDYQGSRSGRLPGRHLARHLCAPKGTPAEVTERLSKSLQVALKDQNVIARFAELGTKPSPESDATPAAFKAKLEGEIARWKP